MRSTVTSRLTLLLFRSSRLLWGYYGASVRLTTWLPIQARTTDPRFSPMARRARYRCPVCRSAIFAFSLQSRLDCFPLRATVAEGTSGVGFMPRFLSSPYEQELRLPPLCHGCLDARPFLSERPPPLFPVFDLGVSRDHSPGARCLCDAISPIQAH